MRFEFEEKTEKQKYSFIVHIVEHEGYGTLHQLVNPLQIEPNQKVFFTHDMPVFKFNLSDTYILHVTGHMYPIISNLDILSRKCIKYLLFLHVAPNYFQFKQEKLFFLDYLKDIQRKYGIKILCPSENVARQYKDIGINVNYAQLGIEKIYELKRKIELQPYYNKYVTVCTSPDFRYIALKGVDIFVNQMEKITEKEDILILGFDGEYMGVKCRRLGYEENEAIVYYGHNLPKKTKMIIPHGSVGFYEKNFASFTFNPVKNDQILINDQEKNLSNLLNRRLITEKNAEKLLKDNNLYLMFIKLMPMDVVYEKVSKFILKEAEAYFGNVSFKNIHLEENYMQYCISLEKEKWAYSIYSLDFAGTISRFYLPKLELNNYSLRNLIHIFGELAKKSCLSGNSAMFLAAIKELTKNMKYPVGYREHRREIRRTRNYALDSILKVKKGILEPKNTIFSGYFNTENVMILENMEEKANEVIATAFKDFLNECMIK